jgi:hypothetical protein
MLFLLLWILSYMLFTVTLAQIKIGRPNGGAGGVPTNIAMNPLIAPLQHVQLPTSSQVRKYSVTRSSKLRVYLCTIANSCRPNRYYERSTCTVDCINRSSVGDQYGRPEETH